MTASKHLAAPNGGLVTPAVCWLIAGGDRLGDVADDGVPGPINGNTRPGGPDLAKLRELGVARVSYGPRFYREALAHLKAAVQELLA
jgi:Phosphoenolpyruvate phosphomutase